MTRVLLADDHAVVRAGLRRILEEHPDLRVVAEAGTGDEVLRALAAEPVDVLVLDISMPGPGVFELLGRIGKAHPAVRTVILTVHPEDQYAVRVLRAGASGYLSKHQSPELLVEAIRKAHRGETYVSPALAQSLAAEVVAEMADAPRVVQVTAAAPCVAPRRGGGARLPAPGSPAAGRHRRGWGRRRRRARCLPRGGRPNPAPRPGRSAPAGRWGCP